MVASAQIPNGQRRAGAFSRVFGVSLGSAVVGVIGLALTVGATLELRRSAEHAESAQLAQRAQQASGIFVSIMQGVGAVTAMGAAVVEATDGDAEAFARVVGPRLPKTILANAALLERSGSGYRQLSWVGRGRPLLLDGLERTGWRTLRQIRQPGKVWVVAQEASPLARMIGVVLQPQRQSRHVIYAEVSIPRAVALWSLDGADFAFYLGEEKPEALLAASTSRLPLAGRRLAVRVTSPWMEQQPLLVLADRDSSTLASVWPWLALGFGIVISLILAGQFEAMRRRRDRALRLAADLNRQSALNRHQALHDPLTGLANRTLFHDRVEQAILRGRRTGEGTAVMMIDLDRFQEINDSLGHESGDLLLQALARRLSSRIRASDTFARLGGDEFGVLAHNIRDPETALALAHKIRQEIAEPLDIGGLEIEVDAGVGVAVHPQHGNDVDTLLRHADIALYRSKELHSPVAYASEHDHFSPTRLQLVTGLRRAIEAGEIVLHYQPQAPPATDEIDHVEALVRWQHPDLGLIPPDQFIPLAEQTGMIRPLTRHVLATALDQCRDWQSRGWTIGVSVNISARDLLDPVFPDEVASSLRQAGVAPHLLELEITEDTLLTDTARAEAVIAQLSRRGVRFAIDDFGVGQSSLTHLRRLPIQVLKIDRSFVLRMADGAEDAVIIRSTIGLAHNLHLKVVAEGVETAEVAKQLAALGCDAIQGYHLSRPLPAQEVERLFPSPGRVHARKISPSSRAAVDPA